MAIVRTLYESPLLRIGDFHCRGGDPRWRACNSIGEGHHLVFPRTAVFIAHEGGEPVLADPSVAVVYRSHERYRRAIADPAGDHCVWVVPNVALARSLERLDHERPVPRFVRTGRRAHATQTLVAWTLARGETIDPLVVEEEMLGVVADALGRAAEAPPSPARTASCDGGRTYQAILAVPSGCRWARSRGRCTSRRFTSPAGFVRAPGGRCTNTGTRFACGGRCSWSATDSATTSAMPRPPLGTPVTAISEPASGARSACRRRACADRRTPGCARICKRPPRMPLRHLRRRVWRASSDPADRAGTHRRRFEAVRRHRCRRSGVGDRLWVEHARANRPGDHRRPTGPPIGRGRGRDVGVGRPARRRRSLGGGPHDRARLSHRPKSGRVVARIEVGGTLSGLAVGAGAVWVADQSGNRVVTPATSRGSVSACRLVRDRRTPAGLPTRPGTPSSGSTRRRVTSSPPLRLRAGRSTSGSPAGASGCRPWPDACGESGSRTRGRGRRAGGRPGSSSPSPVPAASGCSTSAAAGRGGSPPVLRRMGV